MRYIKNIETDPYFNMAFDECCLESLHIDEPVFYLWQNRPAVIIGLNQDVNTEVNLDFLQNNDIALARRVSGGGAVCHDLGNLNYTIVGRSEDLERDYPEYAGWMMQALRKLGVPAELSGRNDILVDGKKVSGFAKRVWKNRLMVHGTLMYDVNLDILTQCLNPSATKLQSKGIASVRSRVTNLREYFPEVKDVHGFKNLLEETLSNGYADEEVKLTPSFFQQVRALADSKFSQWEWIYGRSPRATLSHSARLSCGMVEIYLTLSENRISTCCFGGDFIGNLPVSDIESALKGMAYDMALIRECLSTFEITEYFDGVSVDDLMSIFH